MQGLAIAVGALPCIVIAGEHFGALDAVARVPQALARLQLPSGAVWAAVGVWAVLNLFIVLVCRRRWGRLPGDRVLPLPEPLVTSGAMLLTLQHQHWHTQLRQPWRRQGVRDEDLGHRSPSCLVHQCDDHAAGEAPAFVAWERSLPAQSKGGLGALRDRHLGRAVALMQGGPAAP